MVETGAATAVDVAVVRVAEIKPADRAGIGTGGGAPPPVPILGMHVSISGGMDQMAERARRHGCEAVQIFSRSPQGGKARPLGDEEVARARAILDQAGVNPLVIHTPYFINLVSADEGLREYGIESLVGELERAAVLGAPYVVTHLGRPPKGTAPPEAIELAVQSVARALRQVPDGSAAEALILLLENTAGSAREIGADLGELAALLDQLLPEFGSRVGICLDTCHAHAAGYDLGRPGGVSDFSRVAREMFGPERVRVVHVNDSVGEAGSHLDRHAPIGAGSIGVAGFRELLADAFLSRCPCLLETPGTDEERAVDLERLRRLRAGEPLPAEDEHDQRS